MKNIFVIMVATTALGLASSTYAADESAKNKSSIEMKENGGYEADRASSETNANGTTRSFKSNVNVDVDDDGNITSTTDTKKTVDPKGLMNKTTTETETKMINGRVVEKNVKVD
jgi:FlaG/FlaF family flagellin (archaellin)